MKEYHTTPSAHEMVKDLRVGETAVRADGEWFLRTDARKGPALVRIDPGSASRPARRLDTGEKIILL